MTAASIDTARLAEIKTLKSGSHNTVAEGMCAMEAAAWIAGEKFSDHPECVCPVIGSFMRSWNDGLPDADRTALLLPLIPLTIGTRGSPELAARRSFMAFDWLVRTHTVAWLRLAKLDTQAAFLEALPEITAMAQIPSIRGPIEAVCRDAVASGASAWAATRVATRVAAGDAAWDAAGAAAGAAAWAAAGDASWDAVRAAARAAAKAAHGSHRRPQGSTHGTPQGTPQGSPYAPLRSLSKRLPPISFAACAR